MAELPNFGELGPRLTFKCYEGNVTITTGSMVGGDLDVPVFAAPITAGMYVKLKGDNLIEPCAATNTECIGQVIGTPQFKGRQPTVSKTWGNYEARRVTVELMGKAVRTVTLEAANTKVDAGNSVTFGATTAQTFDKDSTANTTRALAGAAANTGAKIPVLFGFYGAL